MGQWASYKLLNEVCNPASVCSSLASGFSGQAAGTLVVTDVSGTLVTVRGTSTDMSGAGSVTQMTVDVSAGTLNGTAEPTTTPFYPIIAANLGANAHIWNSASSPTINTTESLNLFGTMRTVDELNITTTSDLGGYATLSTSYAGVWDQSSGMLVEFSLNVTGYSIVYPTADSKAVLRFGMVDNNIWAGGTYPDFSLTASGASASTSQPSHQTSTITIHKFGDFQTTVKLTVSSSPNISCTVSPTTFTNGGPSTATLDCSGTPGRYDVTVTGNSGYSTHSTMATMTITNAASSSASSSTTTQATILGDLLFPLIIIAIIGVGIVVALVVIATRRKASVPYVPPSDTPPPAQAQP